ncbi:DUF6884 domain-containing protein (plasmid) [Paraburkholderia kururiensis]|uniref:DUF6884 domain-containing protein n=1 Tax=Paraburkholderia kururiensis TaxID=984307 RepID=UPI0039A706A3
MTRAARDLVILACSGPKLPYAAPALELYQGVMYSTFRAHVRPEAFPDVMILSALHGFIRGDAVIEPYDLTLSQQCADRMIHALAGLSGIGWSNGATRVLLAGGRNYRRVMRAAVPILIDRGCVSARAAIVETSGGIGCQRQQLAGFLASCREIVGYRQNGTALYRSLGGFTVGQPVAISYRMRPETRPRPAIIEDLFDGPAGPTASVLLLDARNPNCARTWVGVDDLQARYDTLF